MATNDFQQQEIQDLSTADHEKSLHTSTDGDSTPLTGNSTRQRTTLRMLPKFYYFRRQRCCLTSNAVILILVWNLILVVGLESFLDTGYFGGLLGERDKLMTTILSGIWYSGLVFLFLFYPLAGCLADIGWGRYKTVVYSVRVIWGSLVLAVVLVCLVSLSLIPVMIKANTDYNYDYPSSTIQITTLTVICVMFGLPIFIAVLFMLGGLVCFSANVIQYGTDLLHDAPTEDLTSFIHWYVWTSYAGPLPMKVGFIIGIEFIVYSLCL